jgi:3-hydroxyacyl-CoA dehydrogenase
MNVTVLGATTLGRANAQLCAVAGHEMRLQADDANAAMDGMDSIERRFDDDADSDDVPAILDNLTAMTEPDTAVADAKDDPIQE